MSMDFRDFEFALFIKDESTPEEELHNRSELYQDETCNLYILMRRKNKTDISTDWRLSIQTIHVMIFLVEDNAVVDKTIQNFKKPLVYKDMLLSGVFKDGLSSEKGKKIPRWLSSSLSCGLFDCFYKCCLRIRLPENCKDYYSLQNGSSSSNYVLQALIKPCPNHFSVFQLSSQIDNLPAFSKASNMNSPFCKQLSALALVKDNSGNTDHISLSLPIHLSNHLGLQVQGEDGYFELFFHNYSDKEITIQSYTNYISNLVFIEDHSPCNQECTILSSNELPKNDPIIVNEIQLTSATIPANSNLPPNQSIKCPITIAYTHNDASSTSIIDFNEKCECDVFLHLSIQWKEPASSFPLTRDYDLKVRLHPKPQLKIEYICSESFTLFQPTHLRVILTNISLHYYKQIHKVVFEKHPDIQCNYEVQQIEELVPHTQASLYLIVIPQLPGVLKLPAIHCVDEYNKIIPVKCIPYSIDVNP